MMKYLLGLILFFSFLASAVSQQRLTAYIFMAEECPVCNYLGKSLKKLSADYNQEVEFVAVFPQRMSNIKSASIFKKKYGLTNFKIKIDHDRIITDRYNAAVTPEVVLVDMDEVIIYQGRIDNSYAAPGRMRHGRVTEDLRQAIVKNLKGISVAKPWPDPIGCYITKR